MLEKGIHDQYEEKIFNMLENGDQKSWGERTARSHPPDLSKNTLPCTEHAKANPLGKSSTVPLPLSSF